MKKNKGFTLVELLAVLIVLVLVFSITLYVYSGFQKESKQTISKIEVAELVNAGTAYYKEFGDTDNYKSYKDKNNQVYSCVSVKSLVDMGYYKPDVEFANSGLSKEKSVVKIVQKSNGVISYELIEDFTKNSSDCVGVEYSGSISETTSLDVDNTNSDVSLKASILKNPSDDDSYILTLTVDADVIKESVDTYPVYVLVVLDTSNSMDGRPYGNAVNAIVELSNSLINGVGESYIGLINFDSSVYDKRKIEHATLTARNFNAVGGGTNILDALDTAAAKMKGIKKGKVDPIKYVIFLTDGEPCVKNAKNGACDYSVSEFFVLPIYQIDENKCFAAIRKSADNIKASGTNLIVVGYNISYPIYKEIGTVDPTHTICPNSSYGNYCYYNSTSNTVSQLFNNLSNTIVKQIQSVSSGAINLSINNKIDLYDANGNKISKINENIKFDNVGVKKYEYKYNIKINKDKLNCNGSDSCSIDLFNVGQNNAYIELKGLNGELRDTLHIKTSPKITIKKDYTEYLN